MDHIDGDASNNRRNKKLIMNIIYLLCFFSYNTFGFCFVILRLICIEDKPKITLKLVIFYFIILYTLLLNMEIII